jgi:cobalt-zinc-cadmium efflux system protein
MARLAPAGQDGSMAHGHGHGSGGSARVRGRLRLVLVLTVAVLIAEVIGTILTGSLALLADAGHMLTDVGGLALAYLAAVLAERPASQRRTWGFKRAEVLAAMVQAAALLAVGVYVLVEGISRLIDPPDSIASKGMLVFGVIGLIANLIGLWALVGSRDHNLNLRAAFLEVVNDTIGSVAVIVAGLVILATGWVGADAVASLLVAALIVPRTVILLRDSVNVLLESTPRSLDLDTVRSHILGVAHVRAVHDLHASQVATDLPVLTAHVVVDDSCFYDGHLCELLVRLQACLAGHFDVEHSTFQFERESHAESEAAAHL